MSNKISLNVCLVPFIHTSSGDAKRDIEINEETEIEMKVGLIEKDIGYSVLQKELEKGESSNKIVNNLLIDEYFQVDRVNGDFYLLLCDCLDGPNRYIGHPKQDASLVFRLDISREESDCPDFTWLTAEELANLAAEKKLLGETLQIIEAALNYGNGRNEPIPKT